MNRLLTAIRNLKPTPIACGVAREDYGDIITPGRIRNKIGSAYTLCAQQCLLSAGRWGRDNGCSEPIPCVFDAGHRNAGELMEAHQIEFKNQASRKQFLVGSLGFSDEQEVVPLQCADLFAYELTQYLSGRRDRHPMKEILKFDMRDSLIRRETLQQMVADHCERWNQWNDTESQTV